MNKVDFEMDDKGESVRELKFTYHSVMLNVCEASPDNRSKWEILHFVQNDSAK